MVLMADIYRWAKVVCGSCPWNFMFLFFLSLFLGTLAPGTSFWRISLPLLSVSCNNRNHTVQESFPINMTRTFVGAFNAEVTSFPWTTLTPYPHVSSILLVFFSGGALEAAFDNMSFFPFKSWDAEDRVILNCISRLFGLSLLVLGNYSPRHGPWVLMESGPGHKFSGPTAIFVYTCTCKYIILYIY